jgi:hypothetical protein
MADLSGILGVSTASKAPPDAWRQTLQLDTLEQQHKLPAGLLTAVLTQESAGDPDATSSAGAQGLFQFMPKTAAAYQIDPYDPAQAAPAAAKELSRLSQKYGGDTAKTLAAWNWGQGNVDRQGMPQAPKETRSFIQRVTGLLSPASAEAATTKGRDLSGLLGDEEEPAPAAPAPASPGGRDLTGPLDERPVVGTQRLFGRDVPIRQPATFQELRQAQAQLPPQEAQPPDLKEGAKNVAATGINVAGALGGAALGTATLGPVGTVPGEIGGSYAARKLNVHLGLEEPGVVGDALAVVPPMLRPLGAAFKWGLKHLPGAGGALHQETAEQLRQIPDALRPSVPSKDLYKQVGQGNPGIEAKHLWKEASEIRKAEQALEPSLRNTQVDRVAADLHDLASRNGGTIPFEALHEHQKRLGLKVAETRAAGGPEHVAYKKLYRAFYSDLDDAAAKGVAEAKTLKEATRAARKEYALEDLGRLFQDGAPGITTRPDGLIQVHGGKLLDRFNRLVTTDKVFRESFTHQELHEVRKTLLEATKLPRLAPPKGQAYGSGQALARGGLTYAVTLWLTQDATTAGILAGGVTAAPQIISRALMSDTGRKWLLATLRTEGGLSPGTLAALTSEARQLTEAQTAPATP